MSSKNRNKKLNKIPSKSPLYVGVKNGKLVIEIGIDTLEFASRPANGGPLYGVRIGEGDCVRRWAEDVCNTMLQEDEKGGSPITIFLDRMMLKTAENGSDVLFELAP